MPSAFRLSSWTRHSPGVDTRNEFHVDHIFPKALFTDKRLAEAGVNEADHATLQDLRDRLPNLLLLEGPINTSKQATPPLEWVQQTYPDKAAQERWLAAYDLTGLPHDLTGFAAFYERRRRLMVDRLARLIGAAPVQRGPLPPPLALPTFNTTAYASVSSSLPLPPPPPATIPSGRTVQQPSGKRVFGRRIADVLDGPVSYTVRGRRHEATILAPQLCSLTVGSSVASAARVVP